MINVTTDVGLGVNATNYDDANATAEDASISGTIISIFFLLYSLLMVLAIIGCKLLHDRPTLSAILPEAGMMITIGFVAGVIIQFTFTATIAQQIVAKSLFTFSSEVFFVGLLPPIICT
jgi:hypothetical protein